MLGVRSNAFSLTRYPVKSGSDKLSFVVDENDAVRKQIDIKADMFGFLGGRETYVVDADGKVVAVHNAQLDVDSHVQVHLAAASDVLKEVNDRLELELDQVYSLASHRESLRRIQLIDRRSVITD